MGYLHHALGRVNMPLQVTHLCRESTWKQRSQTQLTLAVYLGILNYLHNIGGWTTVHARVGFIGDVINVSRGLESCGAYIYPLYMFRL